METQGKILSPGVLYFERYFESSIEKIWSYLTESEKRGKWLAKGEIELFKGGKVTLNFLHSELSPVPGAPPEKYKTMESGHTFTGQIIDIDPPHLLTFTWQDGSEVTFELKEEGNGVKLIITHRNRPDVKETRVSVATGWHTHLEILEANLRGTTPQNFWSIFGIVEKGYAGL